MFRKHICNRQWSSSNVKTWNCVYSIYKLTLNFHYFIIKLFVPHFQLCLNRSLPARLNKEVYCQQSKGALTLSFSAEALRTFVSKMRTKDCFNFLLLGELCRVHIFRYYMSRFSHRRGVEQGCFQNFKIWKAIPQLVSLVTSCAWRTTVLHLKLLLAAAPYNLPVVPLKISISLAIGHTFRNFRCKPDNPYTCLLNSTWETFISVTRPET